MEKTLEQYKEFIEALFNVIKDIEEEYPAFTVAVARKCGRDIPVEERKLYTFYFVGKTPSTENFEISLVEDNIEFTKLKYLLTYRGAIKKLLKDALYDRYTEVMDKITGAK